MECPRRAGSGTVDDGFVGKGHHFLGTFVRGNDDGFCARVNFLDRALHDRRTGLRARQGDRGNRQDNRTQYIPHVTSSPIRGDRWQQAGSLIASHSTPYPDR
jgi:hypothetical protein